MMHVKIYEDVIGCKEVIALWLPKECTVAQWLSAWLKTEVPRV